MISKALRVHPSNPRYFADDGGRAVLLTGSHTWDVLQDMGATSPVPAFDYQRWLSWMVEKKHRFFRMWMWEGAFGIGWHEDPYYFDPVPYARTGPGVALDGRPRFDLTRWDDRYFDRLRSRVRAACEQDIYVAVMLFQGWSVERKTPGGGNPWLGHPFHRENNINGIDGDPSGADNGLATQTLAIEPVLELQRDYIRRVVEAVGEFPNVVYEVENEGSATEANDAWQDRVVGIVREASNASGFGTRPTLRTIQWPSPRTDAALFASPADAVSLTSPHLQGTGLDDWCLDPPIADGRKVSILDTDHLWGVGGDSTWVWKAVLRGHNPIFMDPWENANVGLSFSYGTDARDAMGVARQLFDRLDLAAFVPKPDISSTRFAMTTEDLSAVVAFLPNRDAATFDLRAGGESTWTVEWIHPTTGLGHFGSPVQSGYVRLSSPLTFQGAALVLLVQQP